MAQLRHAETSALIAESSDPLDLVAIAREVGLDRVIFDGVGAAFDIDAAIEQLEQLEQPTNVTATAAAVVELLDAEDPDPIPVVVALERPPADEG